MRTRYYLILGFALLLSQSVVGAETQQVNWEGLSVAWTQYIANPSDKHARAVTAFLPSTGRISYAGSYEEETTLKAIYQDLPKLEKLVLAEQPHAIKTAFRLMSMSDGDMSEWIDIMLGRIIRKNPSLFLHELTERKTEVTRLDALVGNLGPDYVDQTTKQCDEKLLRIAAFNTVITPRTMEMRDRCIVELEGQISRYCLSSNKPSEPTR